MFFIFHPIFYIFSMMRKGKSLILFSSNDVNFGPDFIFKWQLHKVLVFEKGASLADRVVVTLHGGRNLG